MSRNEESAHHYYLFMKKPAKGAEGPASRKKGRSLMEDSTSEVIVMDD